MLEELESVGDDMFQAHLWRDVVYLLTRTFPDLFSEVNLARILCLQDARFCFMLCVIFERCL